MKLETITDTNGVLRDIAAEYLRPDVAETNIYALHTKQSPLSLSEFMPELDYDQNVWRSICGNRLPQNVITMIGDYPGREGILFEYNGFVIRDTVRTAVRDLAPSNRDFW